MISFCPKIQNFYAKNISYWDKITSSSENDELLYPNLKALRSQGLSEIDELLLMKNSKGMSENSKLLTVSKNYKV